MIDLKELVEREVAGFLDWPGDNKNIVTTASAMLFAEHVATLYADHIADARKKVSRPQIREVLLRNGAVIPADRDDLPDYVYESVFELLELAATAAQGEPVAYAVFASNGNIRMVQVETLRQQYGEAVQPLYTAPQPAEQQPVSWIRISGDHVILSRCNWMYPASTEDSAGPRDEQRLTAVGRRDGDIVLPAPEGALDREDLKTMLAWPSASKPAEQQPAPDVSALVEALESLIKGYVRLLEAGMDRITSLGGDCDPVPVMEQNDPWLRDARAALAAHRKQGGEV